MKNTDFAIPFFTLRIPSLSIEDLYQFYSELERSNDPHRAILERFNTPLLQEALYLASPVLWEEYSKYLAHPAFCRPEEKQKLAGSILKYYIRACTRSTPFGLFAGCTIGAIKDCTRLNLSADDSIIRHLRLDMDYLCSLGNYLGTIPGVRNTLLYTPNPTIYKLNGETKYIEYRYGRFNDRSFHLVSLKLDNPVIRDILKISQSGKTIEALVDYLEQNYELERKEIRSYIEDLISNGVLQSSIDPNVTGDEYFHVLHAAVTAAAVVDPTVGTIAALFDRVHAKILDIGRGGTDIAAYREVLHLLKEINPGNEVNESRLFQMDTGRESASLSIDMAETATLLECLEKINNLYSNTSLKGSLSTFKKAFYEKYEARSVKLVEALDSEVGIGFKSARSLADYYSSDAPAPGQTTGIDALAFRKYKEFIQSNSSEIVLTDEDFGHTSGASRPLPDNFSIMTTVLQSEGKTLFWVPEIALSTTNLLGRFCHSNKQLNDHAVSLIQREQSALNGNAIIAEIAHLPQSRVGNVLSRPHLTNYEIEYLSRSSLPKKQQINIDDLYLKIENGDLILFSKKLKKRIIPRLSSAHNYMSGSLDIYHLLGELQHQNMSLISTWSWNPMFYNSVFLPRVSYKNCVLSPAKWVLDSKSILKKIGSWEKFNTLFHRVKSEIGLPDMIVVKESDNSLLLDTRISICLEILKKTLIKMDVLVVQETISNYHAASPAVKDPTGKPLTNEVVFPVEKISGRRTITPINSDWLTGTRSQRSFFPGDEWLYLKIYSKQKNFNSILREIGPLLHRKMKRKEVLSWFFLRYADPAPHLRIRIRHKNNQTDILKEVHTRLNKLTASGFISNMIVDTYTRELERYGDKTIDVSENIFCHNSDLVCYLLHRRDSQVNPVSQDITATFVVDHLLTTFGYDTNAKSLFWEEGYKQFAAEFNLKNNKGLRDAIQKSYRAKRDDIKKIIANGEEMLGTTYFKAYNATSRALSIRLKDLTKSELDRNMASYVHMFINRFFSIAQRQEELIIYYYLDSHYRSLNAIKKHAGQVMD
ncbi:lantibiotic dehydratase [Chitinophaga sp. 22536]|uniref:lantibiotic dehydratase n=1 Tax=unclassified Chitinophaga TaxID=2619133 RepID=UPI003F846E79